MTRNVTALYDTRPEAETARARLSAQLNAEHIKILGRDDVANLDGIQAGADDLETFRSALGDGSYLLIANVANGEDAERIVGLLQGAAAATAGTDLGSGRAPVNLPPNGEVLSELRIPQAEEELRIGKRLVAVGGARVHSYARETPIEEHVRLREEQLEAETRPVDRRLTVEEVESAGLLKDRIIEVSATREEPVVTKEAVVREEVVLRKSVSERVEAIHDVVRRTEIEVEELTSSRGLGSSSK